MTATKTKPPKIEPTAIPGLLGPLSEGGAGGPLSSCDTPSEGVEVADMVDGMASDEVIVEEMKVV